MLGRTGSKVAVSGILLLTRMICMNRQVVSASQVRSCALTEAVCRQLANAMARTNAATCGTKSTAVSVLLYSVQCYLPTQRLTCSTVVTFPYSIIIKLRAIGRCLFFLQSCRTSNFVRSVAMSWFQSDVCVMERLRKKYYSIRVCTR